MDIDLDEGKRECDLAMPHVCCIHCMLTGMQWKI